MDGSTMSAVTELLVDILIGSFSIATLTWVVVGIQTFFNERKSEEREREQARRDIEYHTVRMKEYK